VKKPTVYEGMRTPWGPAQSVRLYIPGLGFASTAGHGGIKLDAARNRLIPPYMRRSGGWYEEDCEWAIPFVVFANELVAADPEKAKDIIAAHETFMIWNPDEAAQFYGRPIKPEESFILRERLAKQAAMARGDLKVVANLGGFDKGYQDVPAGQVKSWFSRSDDESRHTALIAFFSTADYDAMRELPTYPYVSPAFIEEHKL
jgi:hypothetical protein